MGGIETQNSDSIGWRARMVTGSGRRFEDEVTARLCGAFSKTGEM